MPSRKEALTNIVEIDNNQKRNKKTNKCLKIVCYSLTAKKQKLSFFVHVKGHTRFQRNITEGKINMKKSRGRP